MAETTHRGSMVYTNGSLPEVGQQAPDFRLTKTDKTDVTLKNFAGKRIVLNIFPSIDTSTCAASVRKFNQLATTLENTLVLCVSKDLPFAHKRFCASEGVNDVQCLSQYKDNSFVSAYGVELISGSLEGLMARAIVVIDDSGIVKYSELVQDISLEPEYEKVLNALK